MTIRSFLWQPTFALAVLFVFVSGTIWQEGRCWTDGAALAMGVGLLLMFVADALRSTTEED